MEIGGVFLIVLSFILTVTTGKNPDIIIDSKNHILLIKSDDKLVKIGKKRLSKNYQRQLLVISDSQGLLSEKNNKLQYIFKDNAYDVSLKLYSQPIFNIYQQIKSLDVSSNGIVQYSLDIRDLSNRGNCFIYLMQSHYDSECSNDNKVNRPWS